MFKSPAPRCLITGCALYHADTGLFYWGDLHEIGDTYIFNGVVNASSESEPPVGIRLITVHGHCFERRDLWVIHLSQATLNDKAKEHIYNGRQL